MTKRIGTRVGAFRSKFEASIAAQLQDAGVPFEHEAERLPYESPHIYVPDFKITPPFAILHAEWMREGGKTEEEVQGYLKSKEFYVEAKGYFPPTDRRKMLEVKRAHPDLDIRLVFQKPGNKLNPKSGTTYGRWAEVNGFKWAGGEIPGEWLEE